MREKLMKLVSEDLCSFTCCYFMTQWASFSQTGPRNSDSECLDASHCQNRFRNMRSCRSLDISAYIQVTKVDEIRMQNIGEKYDMETKEKGLFRKMDLTGWIYTTFLIWHNCNSFSPLWQPLKKKNIR